MSRGLIYFIGHGGSKTMKIGFTGGDPMKRLRALQTGSPDKLYFMGSIEGSITDERDLHQRFAHLCVSGERFKFEGEFEAFYIQEIHARDLAL